MSSELRKLKVPHEFADFREHAIKVVHNRGNEFSDDIYIIGFFLNPKFKKIVVSKKFSLSDILQCILRLAKRWNYTKDQAMSVKLAIYDYFNDEKIFNLPIVESLMYWKSLPSLPQTQTLKAFALTVLSLVPHSAAVEQLFSSLSHIKTNQRHSMSKDTLKVLGQLQQMIRQSAQVNSAAAQSRKKPRIQLDVQVEELNLFFGVDDSDASEEATTALELTSDEEAEMTRLSDSDSLIATYFDFAVYDQMYSEPVQENSTISKTVQVDFSTTDWSVEDL
eukprot:Pompholyxophrys_punicea_v1_NODE_688_length_1454_cov_6.761973.p1 type:complete len:278 gc:universal NODE_688_length_1454_cov_6.761973:1040-207(-)